MGTMPARGHSASGATTSVIDWLKLVIGSIGTRPLTDTWSSASHGFPKETGHEPPLGGWRRRVRRLPWHRVLTQHDHRGQGRQTVRVLNRPGIGEVVASVVCLAAVLVTLVAVDGSVRERFSALVTQASSEGLTTWEQRADAFGNAVVQAARDRSLDQAPLLVFTVVAAALLIFMLRT